MCVCICVCGRLKEGQEITEDARHRLSYKEGVATLQVTDLEPQDAGQYTCQALNNLGHTDTTADLQVEGASALAGVTACGQGIVNNRAWGGVGGAEVAVAVSRAGRGGVVCGS